MYRVGHKKGVMSVLTNFTNYQPFSKTYASLEMNLLNCLQVSLRLHYKLQFKIEMTTTCINACGQM